MSRGFRPTRRSQVEVAFRTAIHIDFSRCSARTHAEFARDLPSVMKTAIENSGCAYDEKMTPSVNFMNAIKWNFKREGALQVDLDGTISAVESDFDVSDLDNLSPIGMLYQTGYLTIADYSDGLYQLRVPDEEVKRDVASLVAGAWAIGLNFDSKTRQLTDAVHERL